MWEKTICQGWPSPNNLDNLNNLDNILKGLLDKEELFKLYELLKLSVKSAARKMETSIPSGFVLFEADRSDIWCSSNPQVLSLRFLPGANRVVPLRGAAPHLGLTVLEPLFQSVCY